MEEVRTDRQLRRSSRVLPVAIALLLPLAACAQPAAPAGRQGPPPQASERGTCDAAGAQFAVGQEATPSVLQEARRRSGATRVRVIKPGEIVTQEFDPARLTIEVDAANRITSVRCG